MTPSSQPIASAINTAIRNFAGKDLPTLLDWHHLKSLSQVQTGLVEYEARGRGMNFEQLLAEEHDSARLAKHMTANGDARPHTLCHCHAIISGGDPRAIPMRAVLAWLKMRIDFPANGVWLPMNTAALKSMSGKLKNAVPHSRIHRKGYYRWLATLIDQSRIKDDQSLAMTLKDIRFKLETRTFPSYVMLPANQLP